MMNIKFLECPEKSRFDAMAETLMNEHCIIKKDTREGVDMLYRFVEVEFYLYDANEPDKEIFTYNRDCKHIEWFFHNSGVDIAFITESDGKELTRFGGILIRSLEAYRKDESGNWLLDSIVCGPRRCVSALFNYAAEMPDIIALPTSLYRQRHISKTRRINIDDDSLFRYVFSDVNWDMKSLTIIEKKDKDGNYHVLIERAKTYYNPKEGK